MIIDNGKQVQLSIVGVFEGTAGYSRGEVAFVPNLNSRRPEYAKTGQIDGVDVAIAVDRRGGICIATVQGT